MTFRITGLPLAPFRSFFALSDAELAARGARRCVADEMPGFPCRVTLEDAQPGERLVLLSWQHQPADSPYRAAGPIFVRESAGEVAVLHNEVPEQLRIRLLSLRAYDAQGIMLDAEVAEGRELEAQIERFFAQPAVDYIHAHFARRGCYAARIDRNA